MIYFLYIIASILFSGVVGSILLNITKIKSKKNRLWFIIIVVIILTPVLTFMSLKIQSTEKQSLNLKIKQDSIILKHINDSIAQHKLLIDKQRKDSVQSRRNNIIKAVQRYFDISNSRDTVSYDSLFVFPVKKYFILSNVQSLKVNERIRFYWRHNPAFDFIVKPENTTISDYNDSTVVNIVLNEVLKSKKIIACIKYNKNLKIYYLGNSIISTIQTHKILTPRDLKNQDSLSRPDELIGISPHTAFLYPIENYESSFLKVSDFKCPTTIKKGKDLEISFIQYDPYPQWLSPLFVSISHLLPNGDESNDSVYSYKLKLRMNTIRLHKNFIPGKYKISFSFYVEDGTRSSSYCKIVNVKVRK
jgi:hypothetical protein